MSPPVTAEHLLAEARTLVAGGRPTTTGLWPRAAALLGRQALEAGLRTLWGRRAQGLERCSTRAQLLCLADVLGDDEIAADAHDCWGALSRACHHHPYELPPTAGELVAWLDVVERVLAVVRSI